MSITYGSADSDNLSYDPNTGRMLQYLAAINGAQTQKGDLYWNANGTLAQLLISDTFNSANSQICAYAHDDLTRLAQIDCGSGKWGQSFAYDTFGNISKTNLSGRTGINFLPTYSASTNHYSTLPAGTPAYDSNGNLTNDSYHTYAWDSDGNMATIGGTTALTYDALDRRVELAQSSTYTQTLYGPGGAKLALLNGANVAKVFLPLPGGATAVYTSSGLAYYRHPDWLGSSRLASTPSRTVYYDGAYAPYGESYAESGTTDRNFTGQNQDTASDLYDFLYREYHPTQGRWVQPDPAGLAAVDISNPQSWNRYGYVLNGPLTAVDSLGLFGGVPVTTTFTGGPCTTTVTFFLYYPPDNASMPIVMSNSSTSCQAVTIGGRTGSPPTTGPSAPAKSGTQPTFNACMVAHANDASILGAINAGTNALFNRHDTYKNNVVLGALGGNSITSLLYGSTADAAGTGVTLAPTIVTAAMGTVTSYGRRTSTIMALNIAGKGGLPLALGASSAGAKAALTSAGKWLGLGLDFEVKLGIDAAFAAGEAAYCYSQTQ